MKKEAILKFLSSAMRTGEEIVAFLVGGSSYSRPGIRSGLKAVQEVRRARQRKDPLGEAMRREAKRSRKLIQMLKCDDLVRSERDGRIARYHITREGERWLKNKAERKLPQGNYPAQTQDHITIIVYDIPHEKRRWRDWLRIELLKMDMAMLQKSVFIGKIKVPEAFLKDLIDFHLIDYVEIFEVTKRGTLRSAKRNIQ